VQQTASCATPAVLPSAGLRGLSLPAVQRHSAVEQALVVGRYSCLRAAFLPAWAPLPRRSLASRCALLVSCSVARLSVFEPFALESAAGALFAQPRTRIRPA
jgi:hypothetical protein